MIAHARRRWRPRGCAGAPGGLTNQIQNQSTTENNQVWVSDMTYLRTQQGWLYLATIMDIHTRQIIGWAMAQRMNTALIEQALLLAIKQRRPQKEVMVHSDQGSQYRANRIRHYSSVWAAFFLSANADTAMTMPRWKVFSIRLRSSVCIVPPF